MNTPKWASKENIISFIEDFKKIYIKKPIKDNLGGMKSTHMFYVWFTAKMLKPKLIIESGTYKGQSAWLLREACPNAKIISFDPNPNLREFEAKNVEYFSYDFSEHDWRNTPKNSLVFFDDHQNAITRLQQCKWFGFSNIIFDDNYPASQGDCYSIKKALSGSGFRSDFINKEIKVNIFEKFYRKLILKIFKLPTQMKQLEVIAVNKNIVDKHFIETNLKEYFEFPPLYKSKITRWKDAWIQKKYPTSTPLLGTISEEEILLSNDFYKTESKEYTWICYVKLY